MSSIVPLILIGAVAYWFTRPSLPSFTMIYADWCPHCTAVLPSFKLLSVPGVATTWIQSKWSQFKVPAVPAFVYTDAKGNSEFYTGPRDPDSWLAYLQTKTQPTQ